jgi:CPA2 family monovalent cation:H+ antiporter-2
MEAMLDPAVLSYNGRLLFEITVLTACAALLGVAADVAGLPPSLGYIAGGAIVGPSGLGLVTSLSDVGTVAQFGVVFPLLAHGASFQLIGTGRDVAAAFGSALILTALLAVAGAVAGHALGVVPSAWDGLLAVGAMSLCSSSVAGSNLALLWREESPRAESGEGESGFEEGGG